MACAYREVKCKDCPAIVKGRLSPSKEHRCINCAIKVAAQAAMEMRNKNGPAYDKWVQTNGPRGRPKAQLPGG